MNIRAAFLAQEASGNQDGTFMVWSDGGGSSVKPLNWMTPPTVIETGENLVVVRKRAGRTEDRLRSGEAGFTAHLVKPVDPTELRDLLARVKPAA